MEKPQTPLDFTGERIVPGRVSVHLFREHEARYNFARKYVRGKLVVDIACGTGIGSKHLLSAGASRCIGLDLDHEALKYAQAEYGECTFAACDAQSISLADETADVVVSFETLEHVPKQVLFLQECKRILRPGGILVCSTPNRSVYRWFGKNEFHTLEFTAAEFKDLLNSVFTIKEMYCQAEVFYPWHVLQRVGLRFFGSSWLRRKLRRVLRPNSHFICEQAHFDSTCDESNQMIRSFVPKKLWQPTYLVAVALKA